MKIQPFALFKNLWAAQGWKWLHLMVFDDRPREMFLNVIHRLFLERMVKTEAPFSRAVALFGLYTFYSTQPQDTAPRLYNIRHIPIPLGLVSLELILTPPNRSNKDQFVSLKALPSSLTVDHLQPLQPHVSYILSVLLRGKVFFLTPYTETGSLTPRDIPREIFVEEGTVLQLDPNAPKKKGRPTKRDKVKKARQNLDSLDKWLHDTSPPLSTVVASSSSSLDSSASIDPISLTLERYQAEKAYILDSIDSRSTNTALSSHAGTALQKSNQFVLERLKAAEGLFSADISLAQGNESTGLTRVERAVKEIGEANSLGRQGGALNLLEGAGKSQQ
ncbi:hypothetical protein DXG01_011859 [Tephrocybe rancida]|nr:hypothetical protein DXG01_011859 [Tephrocybe rancida]